MNQEQGTKHDEGKLRYDLIPAYPMEMLAAVFTFGSKKYDDWNWIKGIKYSKLFGSLFRHTWDFIKGEDLDKESGLPNLAHAMCNVCMLLYFYKFRKDLDDRKKEVSSVPGFPPGSLIPVSNGTTPQEYLEELQARNGQLLFKGVHRTQDSLGCAIQSDFAHSRAPQLTLWNDSQADGFR